MEKVQPLPAILATAMQLDLSEFKGQQHYSTHEIVFHLVSAFLSPKGPISKKIVGRLSIRCLTRGAANTERGARSTKQWCNGTRYGVFGGRGLFAGYAGNARVVTTGMLTPRRTALLNCLE